jgi:hypothetical protein
LTPKTVLPLFFVIGIIFAPIGGLLFYASTQVRSHVHFGFTVKASLNACCEP